MPNLSGQFMNVEKKIRQMLVSKMQAKMDHAAEMTMRQADKSRDYNDVTGNLYKSTAVGTYYKGELQSVHTAPGPAPTRLTLAKGEKYNLERYYRSPLDLKTAGRRPYVGQYGHGGEDGPSSAEDELLYREGTGSGTSMTWQMLLVAGVDYAKFVEQKRGHDVLTSLKDYMLRYWKKM